MRGSIPPLPCTSSWRGAWLRRGYVFMVLYFVKHRDNFTFTIFLPRKYNHLNYTSSHLAPFLFFLFNGFSWRIQVG
jgi:hypothetical protein